MKAIALVGAGILLSLMGLAQQSTINGQQDPKDSLLLWQRNLAALSSHIDSLKKLVDTTNWNLTGISQKMQDAKYGLDQEIQKGKRTGKPNKAKIDSLKDLVLQWTDLTKDEEYFFDKVLVRLESCIGVQNKLEAKIKTAEKRP